jgi:ACS family hexuronate transporter-like MFS transporter
LKNPSPPVHGKPTSYRWTICALLFFATTINYLDRQVIGLMKDTLALEFKWSEKDYSNIVMAFSTAYAIGLLGFGRLVDKIGTKLGYTLSVFVWSVFAMAHALARSTFGFGFVRAGLGLGEAGNFPVAIKSVAEWFPKRERAFATGIFNSGTNSASIFGPLLIALIYNAWGWRATFLWTGLLGFVWLIFWRVYYDLPEKQKRANQAEVDLIHSDEAVAINNEVAVPWNKLLVTRQAWAFILGKFLTDPIWWFYLFWVPSYFNTTYGLNLSTSAIHVSTVYTAAGLGSVLGGYLPGWLIKRKGWEVFKARKISMLLYAVLVIPVISIRFASGIWTAVALISLALAAHQAWSANIFTTVSDMFPRRAVSSVVGIGGMAGSAGGILFPFIIGILLNHYKELGNITPGYNIVFVVCGCGYLIAWLIMHLLAPKMERVNL